MFKWQREAKQIFFNRTPLKLEQCKKCKLHPSKTQKRAELPSNNYQLILINHFQFDIHKFQLQLDEIDTNFSRSQMHMCCNQVFEKEVG